MFLFINTALPELEIALFDEKKLEFYVSKKCQDENREIVEILDSCDLSNLQGILVSQGPGRFTSLRVGLSYAQTLAYMKKGPLFPFKTHTYFQSLLKLEPHAEVQNCGKVELHIVQQVGLRDVFFDGEIKAFESLPQEKLQWSGFVQTPHLLPELWEEKVLPERNHAFFLALLKNTAQNQIPSLFYGKEPSIGRVE